MSRWIHPYFSQQIHNWRHLALKCAKIGSGRELDQSSIPFFKTESCANAKKSQYWLFCSWKHPKNLVSMQLATKIPTKNTLPITPYFDDTILVAYLNLYPNIRYKLFEMHKNAPFCHQKIYCLFLEKSCYMLWNIKYCTGY